MWMVGKGVGALLSGWLAQQYGQRRMFVIFGVFGAASYTVYWAAYHLFLKKLEKNQNLPEEKLDKNQNLPEKRRERSGDSGESGENFASSPFPVSTWL